MAGPRSNKVTKKGKSSPKKASRKNNNLLFRILTAKNLPRLGFIAIFAGIGSYMLWTSFAATNSGPPKAFVNVPERGLIWAGLKASQASGPCGHLYEVANTHSRRPLCTHGPDPAPDGIDVRSGTALVNTTTTSTAATDPIYPPIPCDGDGTSGYRVQGLYVRASDVPSRFTTVAPNLQKYANRANTQYLKSAQQTGSVRNIRWVHDANCNPIIPEVTIPPTGDDSLGDTINALQTLGWDHNDRKYLLWVESSVYCGTGTIYDDDSPGSNNINNGTYDTSYARVDSGCWNYAEGHELMHNLGGVQKTAPNTTHGYHCTDESDEMCYVDAAGIVLTNPCLNTTPTIQDPLEQSVLFDCNHDDYYYAGMPPAGNYLATHWNIANSSFLMGGGTPPVLVQCNNRVDDDGDGKVDYLNDPGCSASNDTTESPDPAVPPPSNGTNDTIAPNVTISKPANNSTVKSRVDINANGGDNVRVTTMVVYIDDVVKATFHYPYITYTWSASKASSGPHTIKVVASDAAGNVGQSSVTVKK